MQNVFCYQLLIFSFLLLGCKDKFFISAPVNARQTSTEQATDPETGDEESLPVPTGEDSPRNIPLVPFEILLHSPTPSEEIPVGAKTKLTWEIKGTLSEQNLSFYAMTEKTESCQTDVGRDRAGITPGSPRRSGRAQLTHPAPRSTDSLQDGPTVGLSFPAEQVDVWI